MPAVSQPALRAIIRLTVQQLCECLWGSTAGVNGGTYGGHLGPDYDTKIARRRVDLSHVLTVEDRGVVRILDGQDGWIVERLCGERCSTIGRRDWHKLSAAGYEAVPV